MARRRIGGAGGGSDKGSRSGGGVVVAAGLALVLGAGGVAAAGSSSGLGSAASTSSRAAARPGPQNSTAAQARLTARGVRVTARVSDDSRDCAARSYGRVRKYFQDNPCSALHRAQFQIRDARGNVVLVAVSWVEMPTPEEARELKSLVDTDGTGNLTELSRERGRYRSIRYTGDVYASRRDGAVVVNAQAQPVTRGWTGLALATVVTVVTDAAQ